MKVLHLTGWPIPETLAGTEVFVTSLCRALEQLGVHCTIGCLDAQRAGAVGHYQGIGIHRFRPAARPAEANAADFGAWLDRVRPDVVHVHALTEGLGRAEIDVAVGHGYPVVFTAHVPGVVCRRGTMMRGGHIPCDGSMQVRRCSTCAAQWRGLPVWAGNLLNMVPERLRVGLSTVAPGRLRSMLRLPADVRRGFDERHAIFDRCRRVIAVSRWLYDALLLNGVPEAKLVLSRQATDVPASLPPRRPRLAGEVLHVGDVGRYDPIKGVDVLVRAVAGLPRTVPVRLTLHGAADGCDGAAYVAKLHALAGGDPRITLGTSLARQQLSAFFASIHLLAVPSTWLETGPLVVYEALAHRTPVLGSRLGGIAELIRDGQDGWLVAAGDVAAWRRKLEELASPETPMPAMEVMAPAVRTWDQVAAEMAAVYRAVAPLLQNQ